MFHAPGWLLTMPVSVSSYPLVTPAWVGKAQSVDFYTGEKFSDHAPVSIEYASF